MSLISKFQPLIILLAATLGLILGMFTSLGGISIAVVELFLMLLLYILFLSVEVNQLKKATKNVKYTAASLLINFIITPIVAYLLGVIFFADSLQIRIGLLMLLVTPCTDWYLVFTRLARGNLELNMSILPINLVFQVALLPIYLFLFLGSEIEMPLNNVLVSLISVLLIPAFCAIITRYLIANKPNIKNFLSEKSDNLQLLFLCLAVIVMFASEGQNLLENPLLLLRLFIPLLFFFVVTFFITRIIGKIVNFKYDELVSLHLTTLARNSPLALAIAVSVFPSEPLISLALTIGPLIELPILSIVSALLRKNELNNSF